MALEHPIDLLSQRGTPRWLAVLTLYGATLLGLAVIAAFVFSPLVREIDPFVQDILTEYGRLQNRLAQLTDARRVIFIARLPATEDVAAMIVANPETGIGEGLVAGGQRLLGLAGELALAVVIAIYWSMDNTRFERLWLSLLPPMRRTRARRFLGRLERSVGAYVRSEILQTLLAGALLTPLYALAGVPYPFLLATLVALTWLVPIYGGALAVVLAAAAGWLTGWQTAALAAGATLLVLAILEIGVQPRLYHGRRYWGILAVVLMLALGDAFGLIGVLIAPPIAFILQMVIDAVLDRDQAFSDDPVEDTLAAVRGDLDAFKQRAGAGAEPLPSTLGDLTARLDRLVSDVETATR
jgi:predicted PurR-regulated permease PerM